MLEFFTRVMSAIITFFMCIGVAGNTSSFSVDNPDEIKLNITAFSDVGLSTSDKEGRDIFIKSLKSLNGSESGIDVLALIGDSTANGRSLEFTLFKTLVEKQSPAGYNYIENSDIVRSDIFNGYGIVYIGGGELNEEKLGLIETALRHASYRRLPIIVFSYYSASESDEKYTELMTTYPNTFIIAKGRSMEFNVLHGEYNAKEICIPGLVESNGLGCQIELYTDKVIVKQRNYLSAKWTDVERTYVPVPVTVPVVPTTPAEIVAKYNEVINNAKACTSTVAIHKVENVDVHVDDCSVDAVKSVVSKIFERFLKSTDNILNFNNGVATKEDGSQLELGEFIPPNGRNAELDAAGVKEATYVDNGDGTYVLNITLNQETSTFDGTDFTEPTAHKQVIDPLNLAALDISPAVITNADTTYPGLVIRATISDSGELKELYHKYDLSTTCTGKVAAFSLVLIISGSITDTWTFTW